MKVCIYDAAEDGLLGWAWAKGSSLVGNFDHVIAATSWAEAFEKLKMLDLPIAALHVWGHGASGRPLIGGAGVTLLTLVRELAPYLIPSSKLWFRSCNVFQGNAGQNFAVDLAQGLGCTVVGHTRVISGTYVAGKLLAVPWQSGGYALRPGEIPHWAASDEGGSGPFVRNTCLVTRMTVPEGWFRQEYMGDPWP